MKTLSLLLLLSLASVALGQAPSLAVTVSGSTVTVSNVTPHGSVVFFGVARFVSSHKVDVRNYDATRTDDDGDGVVTYDIQETIPWKSIFVAVDFATGRYAFGTPPGFPQLTLNLSTNPLVATNGQIDHVVVESHLCELRVVRPGVGTWSQVVADTNKYDEDQLANSIGDLNVGTTVGVGSGAPAPPSALHTGDIVILIDPQVMESWSAVVP